jgi:hypothetical protein
MRRVQLLAAVLLFVAYAYAAEEPIRRTLSVTGTAEASVKPDICYLSFTVVAHSQRATLAYKECNKQMDKLDSVIRDLGIESRDLQTTSFSITPDYHYEKETDRRISDGCSARRGLSVSVRDFSRVSAMLDAAVGLDSVQVGGVAFTVEDRKKYAGQVRVDALRDARATAQAIAAETGVKIKRLMTISEPETDNGGWSRIVVQGMTSPSVEPGEVKITHTVYITYEIE